MGNRIFGEIQVRERVYFKWEGGTAGMAERNLVDLQSFLE